MLDVMTDRRSSPRYALILSAEVSDKASLAKLAGRTSDISRTGCYIDTLNSIPAGTAVVVRLQHEQEFFEADARVVYVSPGLGMGLVFSPTITPAQQAMLDRWLQEVAKAK